MNAVQIKVPPKVVAPSTKLPPTKPATSERLRNLLTAIKPEQAVAELARRHNGPGE